MVWGMLVGGAVLCALPLLAFLLLCAGAACGDAGVPEDDDRLC